MAILQGYKHGSINCGVCGTNYIKIETTSDPDVVLLSCWEAHSAKAPRSHPLIKQALGEAATQVSDEEFAERLAVAHEASTHKADQRREHRATPAHGQDLGRLRRFLRRT